jgi:hypothetical protein
MCKAGSPQLRRGVAKNLCKMPNRHGRAAKIPDFPECSVIRQIEIVVALETSKI